MRNKDPNYRTNDLALATAISLWYPVKFDKELGSSKISFVFSNGHEIQNLIEQYWKGTLSVDPQRYFQQLKVLKARIHSENEHEMRNWKT